MGFELLWDGGVCYGSDDVHEGQVHGRRRGHQALREQSVHSRIQGGQEILNLSSEILNLQRTILGIVLIDLCFDAKVHREGSELPGESLEKEAGGSPDI